MATQFQKKRALGGGASSGGDPGVSVGPGAGASAAPGATGGAQPGNQSSPGYVNFSRILDLNRGAAQGMADKLVGQVQKQGADASSAVQGANTGFGEKVAAGTQSYSPGIQARSWDPNNPEVSSKDLYAQAGAMAAKAKQGYAGPADWNAAGYDTKALSKQAQEAQDAANNLNTAGGRAALLRQGATGTYTAGGASLDAALSGAALGNRGAELSKQYGNLSQQLVDYQAAGGKAVTAAQATSADAARQYDAAAASILQRAQGTESIEQKNAARQQEEMDRIRAGAQETERQRREKEARRIYGNKQLFRVPGYGP